MPEGDATPVSNASATPLGYATVDADGLPDVLPEVEAAIDRGEPLRLILRRVRTRRDGKRYLAKSFRRRFSVDTVARRCVCCGAATDDVLIAGWFFEVRQNFRLHGEDAKTMVHSHHSLCDECLLAWERSQRWPARMSAIGGYLWIVMFVALIASPLYRRLLPPLSGWLFYVALSCTVFSLGLSAIGETVLRRRVPPQLKALMPRWMKCVGPAWYGPLSEIVLDPQVEMTVAVEETRS